VLANVETRALLPCDTQGLPKPDIRWERDGLPISSTGSNNTVQPSGSLQFSAVQVPDTAIYRCIVQNAAGSVYRDILLTVQGNFLFVLF